MFAAYTQLPNPTVELPDPRLRTRRLKSPRSRMPSLTGQTAGQPGQGGHSLSPMKSMQAQYTERINWGFPSPSRKRIIMPAKVQDVQPTICHDQLGYSFIVWDENGKIALTFGLATAEDAAQVAEQVNVIMSRAMIVASRQICSHHGDVARR